MKHHSNIPAPVLVATTEAAAARLRREEARRTARQASGRKLLAATLAAVLLWAAASLVMARPAAAHDELTGSTPQNGAVLEAQPEEIVLEFSANVMDIGTTTQVLDRTGTDWAAGAPVLGGSEVTIPLQDDMPDGDYQLGWRVVSSDGHPIEGTIEFTLAAGNEPASAPGAGAGGDDANAAAQEDNSSSTGLFIALGAGALAILAGLVAFVMSTRGGRAGGRG